MQFEHRIPLTPGDRTGELPVTLEELWAALLHSAVNPTLLRPDLDHVAIINSGPGCWERHLTFGPLRVIEMLKADAAASRLSQRVLAPDTMTGSCRSVEVLMGEEIGLCLHFRYDSPHLSRDTELTGAQRAAFRLAYAQADAEQLARLLAWIKQTRADQSGKQA